jgi:hypothetical protein
VYSVDAGRSTYGHSIGVIMQHDGLVRLPGDVGNLTTYDFPVTFRVVRDAPIEGIQDLSLLDHAAGFVEAAKELEALGCKAIASGCGFLALLQPVLAAAVSVPVFSSALIQVPLVKAMLPPDRVVGIITAGARNLSEAHFNAVGWSSSEIPIRVVGIDEDPSCAFSRATLNRVGAEPALIADLEASMVGLATRLVEREPAVGAIVFECTNMPPFADAVQRAVNLPVFDAVTLINMVHEAVTRRPYLGHL